MEKAGSRCCPARPLLINSSLENYSCHVNIHSEPDRILYPFPPGILIHITSESLFTSLRNDYSHAPESALDTFNLRNVTDDAELQALADQARALLQDVNIQDLKSTAQLRDRVCAGMQDIAAKLDTMVIRVGRKIRFEED